MVLPIPQYWDWFLVHWFSYSLCCASNSQDRCGAPSVWGPAAEWHSTWQRVKSVMASDEEPSRPEESSQGSRRGAWSFLYILWWKKIRHLKELIKMQPSPEWLKPVALRRTPAVLQTASEANLPHNEPRRWSCAHIMPSFVLQIGLIQTYSTSVCADAKITLAAHPGLAHPELMRRKNTRAVAALPTWQRAGLGPQTGVQSHSVRPSPQTAEALWSWLLVPAVGNNGFRSCGFTDHLATLPTAPHGRKALRRWMMQGAQRRGT